MHLLRTHPHVLLGAIGHSRVAAHRRALPPVCMFTYLNVRQHADNGGMGFQLYRYLHAGVGEEEEIYMCSSRLRPIKMDHRHSGNGRNSQQ
jgi:hypothetical protein